MRSSNRSKILDAAIRVIHRDGVTGVTFDSVAAEAGVTRGGMMYHFPSSEDLIQAIHQHMARRWEIVMTDSAGKPPQEATAEERFSAYAGTCVQSATRAGLLFMLEGSANPELAAPWHAVLDRWAPPVPPNADDPAAIACFIARLAADGLWVHESLSNRPLPPGLREQIGKHLTDMIRSSAVDTGGENADLRTGTANGGRSARTEGAAPAKRVINHRPKK